MVPDEGHLSGDCISTKLTCSDCRRTVVFSNGLDQKVKLSHLGASPRTTGHLVINVKGVIAALLATMSYKAYRMQKVCVHVGTPLAKETFNQIGKFFWK